MHVAVHLPAMTSLCANTFTHTCFNAVFPAIPLLVFVPPFSFSCCVLIRALLLFLLQHCQCSIAGQRGSPAPPSKVDKAPQISCHALLRAAHPALLQLQLDPGGAVPLAAINRRWRHAVQALLGVLCTRIAQ